MLDAAGHAPARAEGARRVRPVGHRCARATTAPTRRAATRAGSRHAARRRPEARSNGHAEQLSRSCADPRRAGPDAASARSWCARCGVAPDSIERALDQAARGGRPARRGAACALKLIDEDQLALALALQFDMPYLRDLPRAEDIPVELIDKLPINFARQRLVLPLGRDGAGRVMVAIADPHAVDVIDAVAVLLGEPVEPVVASAAKITDHINKTYSRLRGGAELEEGAKKDDERGAPSTSRRARRHARRQRRGADHPLGQLADVPGRQGARLGYPHRARREGHRRALPRRRRAARGASARRRSSSRRSSRA